jgi:hypothetical protein
MKKSKVVDITGMCKNQPKNHLKEFDKKEREVKFKKTILSDRKCSELKKNYSAK